MDKDKIIASVSEHYLQLPLECIQDLKECTTVLELEKGTELVKGGAYADKSYYIYKGAARAYLLKDGKDISDWFAFENEFISSINSFFLDVPSPHFIETIEPTILLEMDRENTLRLSDKYRSFERLEKLIVVRTMLKLQHRIASYQFETAKQKYESLVELRPDITQRVPLTHIASYLGITLETLSRVRSPKK